MDNQNRKQTATEKQRKVCSAILKIAAAANCELSKDSQAIYANELSVLSEVQLEYACSRTIPEWTESSRMPPIAFILERGYQWRNAADETRKLLARDDKPFDWEGAGRRAGVTPAEIAKWLEEGKAKARARFEELEKDPNWRRLAAQSGVPGYRSYSEEACAERNGKSNVPSDTDERAVWARQMAVTQGWIEPEAREPGMEG